MKLSSSCGCAKPKEDDVLCVCAIKLFTGTQFRVVHFSDVPMAEDEKQCCGSSVFDSDACFERMTPEVARKHLINCQRIADAGIDDTFFGALIKSMSFDHFQVLLSDLGDFTARSNQFAPMEAIKNPSLKEG